MATSTLEQALDRLRTRAQADDAVAEAVEFLAADAPDDPFGRPSAAVLDAARDLTRVRQGGRRADLARRSLDTSDVVALIESISDRKAVDRRRHRGTLVGIRVGNRTLHPDWQFDRRRGDTRPGLDRLVAALREVATDPLDADAVMVAPREDAGGRSPADVFAAGDIEVAIRLVRMAGDQS